MLLREMLSKTEYEILQGNIDIDIKGIKYDSRCIEEGDIFICIRGYNTDRHDLAKDAVNKGAKALLVEREIADIPEDIAVIKAENLRKEMSRLSAEFHGNPSEELNLIGITGTNGKTSVSVYVQNILMEIGKKTGIIGTIGCKLDRDDIECGKTTPTTPESPQLQEIFREMVKRDAFAAAIEATSVALELHRVDFCDFDIGVFLNLTQDHLEHHGTMENYKNAKLLLFDKCRKAIVNIDDPVSQEIIGIFKGEVITFGIEGKGDLCASNIVLKIDSVEFDIQYKSVKRRVKAYIPGRFTVSNLLAAIACCLELGIELDTVLEAVPKIKGVRGRLEAIRMKKGAVAIVDYAHSPDALKSLLESLKEYATKRIITVFGCGGDRDRTKRPIMGEIAGKLSDYAIITSDNPRSEEPNEIIKDVEAGMVEKGYSYETIANRECAIERAIEMSQDDDIVVVAGKGHETYQILAHETIHFDDMEIIKKYDN